VPLLVGCLIIPLVLWLRKSLEETEVFLRRKTRPSASELFTLVGRNWRAVVLGMMLSIFTTTAFYLITAYTPTFGKEALKLAPVEAMLVTLCVGASNFIWLPLGGALSDRYGRRKFLYAIPIIAILTVYPIMHWLVASPTFGELLVTELWISMLFGLYNGSMIPRLTEIVQPKVRTAAFALAFSLATAVFGGFTPAVGTWLIHETGNKAAPAYWLMLAAAISLLGAFLSRNMGIGMDASMEFDESADQP
jgi:MFS family permease